MGLYPNRAILELQEGGSGANNWAGLQLYNDRTQVIMSNPDGGGVEYADHYAYNHRINDLEIVNTVKSSQPAPFTFTVDLPFELRQFLQSLEGKKSLRARYYEGDYSVGTNYEKIVLYIDCRNTTRGWNRALVDHTQAISDQLRRQLGQRASHEVIIDPVQHADISGTVVTEALNKVRAIGFKQEAGIGGATVNKTGDEDFIFGVDKSGAGVPGRFGYTTDKGATITLRVLTGFNDYDPVDLVKAGPNIVFASPVATVGGVLYANFQALKDNSYTVARASGISAGTAVHAIERVTDTFLVACGATGQVWISRDGGYTWTSAGSTGTTETLNHIAVADENLIYFGGLNGAMVKYDTGVFSAVTVTGLSTTAVTALGVPSPLTRGTEVYVGSAAGNIHVSKDEGKTWSTASFDLAGTGAIDDLAFSGADGCVAWVIQTNGSTQSRVLRDLSGGRFGPDVEILGGFTNPGNTGLNSIAVSSVNHALCVGEVEGGQGVITRIA